MNVVGYKVLISKEDTETLNKFYMNVVGYKDGTVNVYDFKYSVLYERSGI